VKSHDASERNHTHNLPAVLIPDRVCPSARLGEDAGARSAARVNGAMTRAEASLDDVVATIAPRMVADAARTIAQRPCVSCGRLTEGSKSVQGHHIASICPKCKAADDAALDRRLCDTARALEFIERKVRPVFEFDFDAPQCVCGCREFIEIEATEYEPDTGRPGNNRGLDCKDCGEFYERD